MNEKISTDLTSLKLIFNKNKPYILSIAIMLVSIILFLQFVIPQFQVLLATEKKVKETSLKLETLKANLNILTNINDETLNSQIEVLNSALPLNKDLIGILNSVYSTAQKTGVSLGSFSFTVGDLAQSENANNFSIVRLSVPIDADVIAINSFVETISKTLPLSEVNLVRIGKTSSTVDLSFYYMPLGASNYGQDVPISPISQKGLMLIDQLGKYENISSPKPSTPVVTATPAFTPDLLPTSTPVATSSAIQ